MNIVRKYLNKMQMLDVYIMKQVLEVFFLGMAIFTGLVFASDSFLSLIKDISNFGMPLYIAAMIILLNFPAIIVLSIPMSALFSTIMVLNRLCLSSEITVLKACGIGLHRISAPIFIFAFLLVLISFFVNEAVVPITSEQSKTLALWSLGQKNVPNGKHNFVLKEEGENAKLNRLFFVDKCEDDKLYNVVVLDMSTQKNTTVSYAKLGKIVPEGWALQRGLSYKIDNGKLVNNTNLLFDETIVDFGLNFKDEITKTQIKEYNIIALHKYLEQQKAQEIHSEENNYFNVMFYDKFALPMTTLVLVLIGIPLAITPPRVRYNRGILFSILIIFFFYLIRAVCMSLGEKGILHPAMAAFMPNIVVGLLGAYLYWRKVYKIN